MHQLPDSAELPTWSGSREATPVSRPQSPRMYHSSCMHPCWGSCSLPDHRCRITKDPITRMHAEQPPLQAQGTPMTISTGRGPCIEGCAPLCLCYGELLIDCHAPQGKSVAPSNNLFRGGIQAPPGV